MKQIRISKQHRPARKWLEPLPLELASALVAWPDSMAKQSPTYASRVRAAMNSTIGVPLASGSAFTLQVLGRWYVVSNVFCTMSLAG